MDSKRLKQIEKIYHAVLEIAPNKREVFFKKNCGADDDLRREVESLLAFENSSDDFLETPPESLAAEMFAEKDNQTEFIGKKIEHYKIIKILGKGGMGEVYLAEDVNLNRQVALKFLPAELTGNIDRLKRFEREAQTASGLNHPNILTVHQFGTESSNRFIVTEFVNGVTLSAKMADVKLAISEILDVAGQVAAALTAAHEAGIIHRDIKPDNIMIRGDGLVKVLDFGLAKLIESPEKVQQTNPDAKTHIHFVTNPGVIMGTADYMSPEQARGKAVDARTDIFSFGAVLYEMLTGQKPFSGETINHTIVNVLEKETPSVFDLVEDCPEELGKIIHKTLAKNADERFQTAKELLSNLKKLRNRLELEEELRRTSKPNLPDEAETQIYDTNDDDLPISTPNNLTKNPSPIIGREQEIAEISDLLKLENVRLLTMTGVGGTGKTRLAQTVAKRVLRDFADGVFFVALAAIADSKLVVSTIANTLGVKESGGEPLLEVLKNHLRGKKILLVVDNFEQVNEAAPDIAELLEAGDKLKILITSRELLHLSAEREHPVLPLAVPTETKISPDELLKNEAVRFFIERARFAQTNFALTDENAVSIAEICRRLDGLPLAIELAAAHVKLFSPAAILNRLSDSLKLLTGGAKDLPERQQTMRGAIAWSYDLLDAEERKLFNRLAVFAGGFTLDGAETVAFGEKASGDGIQNTNSGIDIYDGISSLLDKSLIIRSEQKDGEPRFRMLVVVREFAFEKLAESGETAEIKRLHAEFYAVLAEAFAPQLKGDKAAEWLDRIEAEHDNLRSALEWSLANEPETAVRIVLGIWNFWLRRVYLAEGIQWTKQALENIGTEADKSYLFNVVSFLSLTRSDFKTAETYSQECLRIARLHGDQVLIGRALSTLGLTKQYLGETDAAQALLEEVLEMARADGTPNLIAGRLVNLGTLAQQREDYEAARKYHEEAYAIAKAEGLKFLIAAVAGDLAETACRREDYETAFAYAMEGIEISEKLNDKVNMAYALHKLGGIAVAVGEAEKAARLWGAAQTIFESEAFIITPGEQKFLDRYTKRARAAIGDEAFDAAFADGRKLSIEEAIALAREGESDILSATHITDGASSKNTNILTGDALEAQTAIFQSVDKSKLEISRPNNFLANIRAEQVFITALIICLLAAGGFFGYRYFTTEKQIKSIAVMPFVIENGNQDSEYLSDGMTETLIGNLSQVPDLSVKARFSVFRYKGREIDAKTIGKELDVQAILNGRIVQRGDRLIVNLELVETATENVIWSQQYNRSPSEIASLQSEIARDVTSKLKPKLSGAGETDLTGNSTTDADAYKAYLKGRYLWNKRTGENLKKAIEQFKSAIESDPSYALAYAGLADCYAILSDYTDTPDSETLPQAKAYAERAIAVDNRLAEPHAALGSIYNGFGQWAESEREFKKAIELNPNYATAYHWYSILLRDLGRFDESALMIKRARELDPLSNIIRLNVSQVLQAQNRWNESVENTLKIIEFDPTYAGAYNNLALSYLKLGRGDEAIANFQKSLEMSKGSDIVLRNLGYAFAVIGRRAEALAIAKELEEKYAKNKSTGQNVAAVYNGLGDQDKAFEWLEKDFQNKVDLGVVRWALPFESLRDDPRYKDLLKRMNLPN